MPDENSTQIWVAQTSQNNQVEEKSENDFILDFWDEEEVENVNESNELDTNKSLYDEWEDIESSVDNETNLELNQDLFEINKDWESPSEPANNPNAENTIDKQNILDNEQLWDNEETEPDDFTLSFDVNETSNDTWENIDIETTKSETEFLQDDTPGENTDYTENDDLLIPDESPIATEEDKNLEIENNGVEEENSSEKLSINENQNDETSQQDTWLSINWEKESNLVEKALQENEELQSVGWDDNSEFDLFNQNDDASEDNTKLTEDNSVQNSSELFDENAVEPLVDDIDTWSTELSSEDHKDIGWENLNTDINQDFLLNEDNQQGTEETSENTIDNTNSPDMTNIFNENQDYNKIDTNQNDIFSEDNTEFNLDWSVQPNSESTSNLEKNFQISDQQLKENNSETISSDMNEQGVLSENTPNSNDETLNTTTTKENMNETVLSDTEVMPNIVQNTQLPNTSELNNQWEIAWNTLDTNQKSWESIEIKSTLSLDQILDSELMANPQFTDTSKASPNNIPGKQNSSRVRIAWVVTWILIFLLAWFVVTLAFPSLGINWHFGNKWNEEIPTESIVEDESTADTDYQSEGSQEVEDYTAGLWFVDDIIDGGSHWVSSIEFPEDTVDEGADSGMWEDDKSWEYAEWLDDSKVWEDIDWWKDGWWEDVTILPYTYLDDDYVEDDTDYNELTLDFISSKILAFKSEGDNYYSIGVNDSNEKIIKYASYIQYLCDDYQSKVELWDGLDQDSWDSFESEVNKFFMKIDRELGWTSEVETIYAHQVNSDTISYEEKDSMREYLTTR